MHFFPATESTLSATYLGLFLQEVYRLAPQTTCKLFRTGMNHLYIVADGDIRYVLRVYTHNWRTYEDVAEEIRLLNHLKDNNVPVAYPVADPSGNFVQELMAPEGMRYAVLFSFAEGKKDPRFGAEAAYQIGAAMGKLHTATQNFFLQRLTYDTATLLRDAMKRTAAFFGAANEDVQFLANLAQLLEGAYAKADAAQMRIGALHLDIWFDNLHIDEDGKVTLYDFDFCGNGWLCHDMGYFLYQLLSTNPAPEDYQLKSESFLEGYKSIVPFSDEEKRFMPYAALGVLLFYISIQCDRYDTWSNIFLNEDHLNRYCGSLRRWMAHNKIELA